MIKDPPEKHRPFGKFCQRAMSVITLERLALALAAAIWLAWWLLVGIGLGVLARWVVRDVLRIWTL